MAGWAASPVREAVLLPALVAPACTEPARGGVGRLALLLGETKCGCDSGAPNGECGVADSAIMEGEASDDQRSQAGEALGESSG